MKLAKLLFTPEKYPSLVVNNPDLWWPYTMGSPALYDLQSGICAGTKSL